MRRFAFALACLLACVAAGAVYSQVPAPTAVVYEGGRLIIGDASAPITKAAGEALPENFTPANLLDHLQREVFYGVGTANDGGRPRRSASPTSARSRRARWPTSSC